MRRALTALLLSVALLLGLAPVASVLAVNGTISGQIIGQNGATNIAGTLVRLEVATVVGGAPEVRTTVAGDDGSFRFADFPYNQNAVYLLRIVYEGGNYFREVEFPKGQTVVDVGGIEVYPATRDEAALSFLRMNTIFSTFDPKLGAQIIETGAYSNTSNGAYVGRDSGQNALTLRFGLPNSAIALEPVQGLSRDTMLPIDDSPLPGFAVLNAIPPGERQFAFMYKIAAPSTALQGSTLDFNRIFPYKTGLYSLYLPANVRIASSGGNVTLRDSGEQTQQNGQKFRVFTANDIPAGGQLAVRFTGLSTAGSESDILLPALLVFVLLTGLGLILVYGRRRGTVRQQVRTVPANAPKAVATKDASAATKATRKPRPAADPTVLVARREELLREMADLDDRHDRGDLPAAEYQQLRQRLKERLVATLQAISQDSAEDLVDTLSAIGEQKSVAPAERGAGRSRS